MIQQAEAARDAITIEHGDTSVKVEDPSFGEILALALVLAATLAVVVEVLRRRRK